MTTLELATLDELVNEISTREGISICSWGDDRGVLVILPKVKPEHKPQPMLTSSPTPDDITDSEMFMEEYGGLK